MRILLGWRGKLYRLLDVESSDRDGSLSVTLRRALRKRQITVHQSGRINYKEAGVTIYLEPLLALADHFTLYRYRVPQLLTLNEFKKTPSGDDAVLDIPINRDGAVSFLLVISPESLRDLPGSVRLTYLNSYAFTVICEPETWAVDPQYEMEIMHAWPTKGRFTQQQVSEENALISHHQALQKTRGSILYAPNAAGIWTLIFSVPMRIAPRVRIEPADPLLYVADEDVMRDTRAQRVMLKFRVRKRATRELVKEAVGIRSISLDSEL